MSKINSCPKWVWTNILNSRPKSYEKCQWLILKTVPEYDTANYNKWLNGISTLLLWKVAPLLFLLSPFSRSLCGGSFEVNSKQTEMDIFSLYFLYTFSRAHVLTHTHWHKKRVPFHIIKPWDATKILLRCSLFDFIYNNLLEKENQKNVHKFLETLCKPLKTKWLLLLLICATFFFITYAFRIEEFCRKQSCFFTSIVLRRW